MPPSMLGPPRRVLFVGDSLTYCNNLDEQVAALAHAADPVDGKALHIECAVRGGAPLKALWKKTDARQRIAQGRFDAVVLQEDLPETSVQSFHEYAARFHEHIQAADSATTTVLLMTWPYERLNWIGYEGIAAEHWKAAAALGARVAPAGLAWQRAEAKCPEFGLYEEDGEHPSAHGTYLTACVVFSTLWGRSAVDLPSAGVGDGAVSQEAAAALQRIAWEVVEECRTRHPSSIGSSAPSAMPTRDVGRDALVSAAFAALDRDGDGRLSSPELRAFGDFMGFEGADSAWDQEYAELCGEVGARLEDGVNLDGFRRLVNDGTERGLTCTDCTDSDLSELLQSLNSAVPGVLEGEGGRGAGGAQLDQVVIVPGNGDGPVRHSNWYGWLATELEKLGVKVGIHDMPDPVYARESQWLPFIEKLAGGHEQLPRTIVVGHSSGSAAAMRLAEKRRIGGVVLVAAYTSDLDDPIERESGYFSRPWRWEAQRANCGFIVQFASTDDPFLPIEEQREVRDGLSPLVEYVEFDGRSHFFDAPFRELLDVVRKKLSGAASG